MDIGAILLNLWNDSGFSQLILGHVDVAHGTAKITPGSNLKVAADGQAQLSSLPVEIGGHVGFSFRILHGCISFFSAFSSTVTAASSGVQGI